MADLYGGGGYKTQVEPDRMTADQLPGAGGGGAPGAFSSYFFDDPIQRYYETAIRKRIGEVQTPLDSPLPGMEDFKSLLGQFGGSYGAGGAGSPQGTRLDPFKAFAASFNPGVASGFNQYVQSRNPTTGTQGLSDYTAGRNPTGVSDDLKAALAAMGPNTSIDDLKAYFADPSRDLNVPVDTLKQFLTDNAGMLTGYEGNMAARIAQLRGNPFDDTVLAARRNAGFSDIEAERQVEKQQLGEQLASRGIMPGSGLYDRAQREIDTRYDKRRQEQQGQMTQEEFQLREDHGKQADALEAQGASFRLQSAQLAGDLTGQIAQLQQQGISLNDAMQQTIANLGLQSRKQEQDMLGQIAQLTNQGYQLQDALQIALNSAGLEAQRQADALRTSGADFGLKESEQMRLLQQALADLGVTERGQDTNLQIAGIDAASRGQQSSLSALMDYFRLGQNQQITEEDRRKSAVDLAGLLDAMARGSLKDSKDLLPSLSGAGG